MSPLAKKLSIIFSAGLAIAASGCGGDSSNSIVGKGNGPSFMEISATGVYTEAALETPSVNTYLCVTQRLHARIYFEDDTYGDFTSRVTWSSSNPSVVQVTNTNTPDSATSDPFVSGAYYPAGTMLPVGIGSAEITATFENLIYANIEVSVGQPENITVQDVTQLGNVPIYQTNGTIQTGLTIAPGTQQQLAVTADLSGVETDVSKSVLWTLSPSSGIASVNNSGLFKGQGSGGPAAAKATFPVCGYNFTMPLSVSPIQSIQMIPAFGDEYLATQNKERIDLVATLADGTLQDLSTQPHAAPNTGPTVAFTSLNPAIAAFGKAGTLSQNYITGVAGGGPDELMATFYDGRTEFEAPDIALTVASAQLTSITVSPTLQAVIAGSDITAKYTATGTFNNALDADGDMTQDVTNLVIWKSLNTKIAKISSNAPPTSGYATPTGIGQVTLTAEIPESTASKAGEPSSEVSVLLDVNAASQTH